MDLIHDITQQAPIVRYQVGRPDQVPPGAVIRMRLFMDAAGLPMFTQRHEDGTVVQMLRLANEDIVRVYPPAAIISPAVITYNYTTRWHNEESYSLLDDWSFSLTGVLLSMVIAWYGAEATHDMYKLINGVTVNHETVRGHFGLANYTPEIEPYETGSSMSSLFWEVYSHGEPWSESLINYVHPTTRYLLGAYNPSRAVRDFSKPTVEKVFYDLHAAFES